MNDPLLFFADIELPEEEASAFHESYATHIPTKLKAPGFLFGYSYMNPRKPQHLVSLYGIKSPRYLRSLFSKKIADRHPVLQALSEEQTPYSFVDVKMGIYQLKTALPREDNLWFSDGNHLHLESWNWKESNQLETLGRKYDHLYMSPLVNLPEHFRAYRFERIAHDTIDYLNTAPKNLVLFEYDDTLENTRNLYKLKEDKIPLVEKRRFFDLQPVAKHWPFAL